MACHTFTAWFQDDNDVIGCGSARFVTITGLDGFINQQHNFPSIFFSLALDSD